jgi:hypothetical protein
MFKRFDTIKAQLAELAPAINAFKSEAVQLRIVELIFNLEQTDVVEEHAGVKAGQSGRAKRVRRARTSPAGVKRPSGKTGKKKSGGSGPIPTLNQLIEGAFFAKHRTLNDIIEHCRNDKARTFKPNQLSGPLGRLVRDQRLKRQKNADGQYEYWK